MKTVLFAWELGANLGHVGPLLRIARELQRAGHRAVFALRDVVGPRALFGNDPVELFQAPVWPRGFLRGRPFRMSSYADLLALEGFADAEGLGAMVDAWDALLRVIKPDLIVLDHSPTLCLGAHGTIPIVIIGTGYTVPPAQEPVFATLFPQQAPLIAETRLLENVHAVQRRRGRGAPLTLPALLDAPLRAIACFPELDPYRAQRREPLLGPLEKMPAPTSLQTERSIFAYIGEEHPAVELIVEALVGLNCRVEVYLRGGDVGALRRVLAARGVCVHDRPPPLGEVVRRASVVVSHGGATTAHAALAAGRPQLLLPTQPEQELTADALVALEAGVSLRANLTPEHLASTLRDFIENDALGANAQRLATAIANRPAVDGLATAVEGCMRLLA